MILVVLIKSVDTDSVLRTKVDNLVGVVVVHYASVEKVVGLLIRNRLDVAVVVRSLDVEIVSERFGVGEISPDVVAFLQAV